MKDRTLTDDDIEAIAEAVVEKSREVLLLEAGRILWSITQKAVIGGVMALFALDQIKGWLK